MWGHRTWDTGDVGRWDMGTCGDIGDMGSWDMSEQDTGTQATGHRGHVGTQGHEPGDPGAVGRGNRGSQSHTVTRPVPILRYLSWGHAPTRVSPIIIRVPCVPRVPSFSYLVGKDTWLELWPSEDACQEPDLMSLCQDLLDFAEAMTMFGCPS